MPTRPREPARTAADGSDFGGGSIVGALLATQVPGDLLRAALPLLLIAIALYFGLKPRIGDEDRARRISPLAFSLTLVPLIGFYDGVFGPGTGSFFMLGFVTLAGFGILKATAHTKLLNFGSNLGAFAVFSLAGVVLWKVGIIMGVGQFLGAQLGSRLAMRIGSRMIKPLLVISSIALAIRLLADPANPCGNGPGSESARPANARSDQYSTPICALMPERNGCLTSSISVTRSAISISSSLALRPVSTTWVMAGFSSVRNRTTSATVM